MLETCIVAGKARRQRDDDMQIDGLKESTGIQHYELRNISAR